MADITLTLNDEEQKALAGVIDMALRHSGIGAADVAAHFIGKLRVAAARAEQQRELEKAAPVPAPAPAAQDIAPARDA